MLLAALRNDGNRDQQLCGGGGDQLRALRDRPQVGIAAMWWEGNPVSSFFHLLIGYIAMRTCLGVCA